MDTSRPEPTCETDDRTTHPTRRDLLGAAAGLAICALCTGVASAATSPATKPAAGPKGEADAGPATAFKADGVYDGLLKSHRVLIVRSKGGVLHACSATCTHRNALLQKDPKGGDGAFRCPKHDSVFDAEGIPISGPAKTSLPRYAIRLDDKGHVRVDTSKTFQEREWKDPAASVTLPA